MKQAVFCFIEKGSLASSWGQVAACYACNSSQLYSQTEQCRRPVKILTSSRGSSSRQHNELGWLHRAPHGGYQVTPAAAPHSHVPTAGYINTSSSTHPRPSAPQQAQCQASASIADATLRLLAVQLAVVRVKIVTHGMAQQVVPACACTHTAMVVNLPRVLCRWICPMVAS